MREVPPALTPDEWAKIHSKEWPQPFAYIAEGGIIVTETTQDSGWISDEHRRPPSARGIDQ